MPSRMAARTSLEGGHPAPHNQQVAAGLQPCSPALLPELPEHKGVEPRHQHLHAASGLSIGHGPVSAVPTKYYDDHNNDCPQLGCEAMAQHTILPPVPSIPAAAHSSLSWTSVLEMERVSTSL